MSKNPARMGLLTVALLCGAVAPVNAQVTVAQVLGLKPKCDDVVYTTPAPEEIAKCHLESKNGKGGGHTLTDANKRLLRKFVDHNGDGYLDAWSYYKDGEEAFRETIVDNVYTCRWIGPGGMKWGVGTVVAGGKAKIESWRMISADEAAHEAFQALATGNFERMKALFITPQEIQALGLPASEGQKLMVQQQNAQASFQKVLNKLPGLSKAKFAQLENVKVGAYPKDLTGGTNDIVKIPSGVILFENEPSNPKKHDWLQSHEIIQVGNVWRLTNVPSPEDVVGQNPELAKLSEILQQIDKLRPPEKSGKLGDWTKQRVQILEKIAAISKADEQESWYKQILDNLAFAIVDGDDSLLPVLTKWKTTFATSMPGGNLAGYATYREIWSSFQRKLTPPPNNALYLKLQQEYLENLEKFIKAYPKADDTPDALLQLANGSEFAGKDDEAKKWYGQIVANFPNSSNGPKAAGAIRRLDAVGKTFVLTGATLNGKNYTLRPGKITVVYYWASYSASAVPDFAAFKKLQETVKDIEIVTVNLDDKAKQAIDVLQRAPLNAEHLHQPDDGVNGGFGSYYGIFALPHLFLIDRDGRVVNNKAQVNALEEEIAKLTKK